jgi:hypothetical protein
VAEGIVVHMQLPAYVQPSKPLWKLLQLVVADAQCTQLHQLPNALWQARYVVEAEIKVLRS